MAPAAVFLGMALILQLLGQPVFCSCGEFLFWGGDTWSSHNSQHLFDFYSVTHVSHGVLLAGAIWLLVGNRISFRSRLLLMLLLEAAWEIVENTPMVISRYRTGTVSLDYTGDSIVNSVGDLLSCLLGFLLASGLGLRKALILFVVMEVLLLFIIRDNLTLNVLMLTWPIDAIREWQAAGHTG